jgi:hypothetical protein
VQVLTKGVKPPTPDAAKAAGVGHQQALALQHVRLQLARLVKQAYPKQVCVCRTQAVLRPHLSTHCCSMV